MTITWNGLDFLENKNEMPTKVKITAKNLRITIEGEVPESFTKLVDSCMADLESDPVLKRDTVSPFPFQKLPEKFRKAASGNFRVFG